MVNTKMLVIAVIAFMLFGALAPTALSLIEGYSPTDTVLAIVWPLSATLFVLGIALAFFDLGDVGLK